MKKRLPLITLRPLAWILFLLITASGYAQESLIQGLVIDENGEPLIGVSIQDQKTQTGTISDIDGKFSLEARIGNMLKISYIGYRTVTLAAAKDMRVVMSEDNMKLDEVVVCFMRLLDLISKSLLTPLIYVGHSATETGDVTFYLFDCCCTLFVFKLHIQNNG